MPINATLKMAALLRGAGSGSLSPGESVIGSGATDPIPAARQTDWTYTGIPGGIPTRTTIASTFSAGASAASITSALNSAASGTVVFLNAGIYSAASLGGFINFNGVRDVTLRGAGIGLTILQGGKIVNQGSGGGTNVSRAITGAVKDGFTFNISVTTGLVIGNMIEVSRNNDTNLIPASFDTEPLLTQVNVITGISGNTITVRNPWIYDFSIGSPILKWLFSSDGSFSNTGIEDMTLEHGVASVAQEFWYGDKFWLKNVESYGGTGYHFVIIGSVNFEARGCYFHDGGAGPNNSGINMFGNYTFGSGNTHWRIEDCIFKNMFPGVEVNNSSSGGYVGYCYIPGSNTGVSWSLDDGHAPYNMMNLYEGNQSDTWGQDGYFGGAGLGTVFRNYLTGENIIDPDTAEPVKIKRLGYYYNVVGNVLGSTGQNPTAYTGCDTPAIYSLGYPNIGNCSLTDDSGVHWTPDTGGGVYPDANVAATLMRWANYDYFNDATQFNTSELGGVATPPDHTLIDSYVYDSTPSWWTGGIPWPPIGPDVTGGDGDTSGHVYKIPARVRYETARQLDARFNGASNISARSIARLQVQSRLNGAANVSASAEVASASASIVFQQLLSETGVPDGTLGAFTVASAAGQERLLCLCSILQNEADTYSSVAIDGQSATQVGAYVRAVDVFGNGSTLSFWRAAGTSNTTIDVTYSSTVLGTIFDIRGIIWTLNNVGSLFDSTIVTYPTAPPISLDVDTVSGGVVAAVMLAYDSATHTTSWSGLTESFDGNSLYSTDWVSTADLNVSSGSTPLTVTATLPVDFVNDGYSAMAVSFSP